MAIPNIIGEWNVGLNEVVHGLITWNILTLGAGVSLNLKPNCSTDGYRISFGLLQLSISESDRFSCLFPFFLSQLLYGLPEQVLGRP